MSKIAVIINPKAGGYSKDLRDRIGNSLRGFDFEILETAQERPSNSHRKVETNLEQIIKDECKKGVTDFVVCGGDGTISESSDSIIKHAENYSNMNLSVMPIGTGNDFALGGLGIRNIDEGFESLERFYRKEQNNLKRVDVFRVEIETESGLRFWRYGINSADVSFGAHLLNFIENTFIGRTAKKLFKGKSYGIMAIPSSFGYKGSKVRIDINGQTIINSSDKSFLGAWQNSEYAGGRLRLCPRAKVDDGTFDFLFYERKWRYGFPVSLMMQAKKGKVDMYEGASQISEVRKVEIFANKGNLGNYLTIDGELYSFESPIKRAKFEEIGKKLRFVCVTAR